VQRVDFEAWMELMGKEVYGLRYAVCGIWYMVYGMRYAVQVVGYWSFKGLMDLGMGVTCGVEDRGWGMVGTECWE